MPAFLLNPSPGTSVIDACAAPGMKTSHLAALLGNSGFPFLSHNNLLCSRKVWAMDRSKERLATLKQLVARAGVSNVSTLCTDFLRTDPNDKRFVNVSVKGGKRGDSRWNSCSWMPLAVDRAW